MAESASSLTRRHVLETVLSKPEWATCAGILAAATGRVMERPVVAAYYEVLKDLRYDVLLVSCKRAVQESQANWLPSAGLLRKFAAEAVGGATPQASSEWERVRKLVRQFGYMRRSEAVALMPAITRAAVESIGWDTICDTEQPTITGAQFRKAYEELASQESTQRRLSADVRPKINNAEKTAAAIECATKKLTDKFSVPGE